MKSRQEYLASSPKKIMGAGCLFFNNVQQEKKSDMRRLQTATEMETLTELLESEN